MNTQAAPMIEIAAVPEVLETEAKTTSINQPIRLAVYEKRRWLYILALPLMWLLTVYVMAKKAICKLFNRPVPRINSFWFDGLGLSPRKVKENAASWQALDEIYNYNFDHLISPGILVDNFWEGMMNCQALRNRFKLVKQELRRAILRFSNHKEVRLISLASGSAQAVIEVLAELKTKGIIVRVVLLDIDQSALDYAMGLARKHSVSDQIEPVRASVSRVVKISRDFKPQVIEMVGLLDYIPQQKAIRLATKIRESLEPKGVFITCNIASNLEMYFVHWVVNWSMIYRTPEELAEVIVKAGFSDCRLIYEPLKIHGLAIAQKDSA